MRTRKIVGAALVALPLTVLGFAGQAAAAPAGFEASLNGPSEVPVSGDPDGVGVADVTIDTATNEVCWNITYSNIDTVTAAHIHVGAAGVPGGVVVNFTPSIATSAPGTIVGCTTTTAALATTISAAPAGYYVNVHTLAFPGGAIRGQLAPATPDPIVPESPWVPLLPVTAVAIAGGYFLIRRGQAGKVQA